jgi:hypothetical protein
MRDVFLAFVEIAKETAAENYRTDMIVWAILAAAGSKRKPPDVPKILR